MARLVGPDMGSRYVYLPNGHPAAGRTATVYIDSTGMSLADIRVYDGSSTVGAAIPLSKITIDDNGLLPQFWFPEDVDRVYVSVNDGVVTPIDADANSRLDYVENMIVRDLFGYMDNAIEPAPRFLDFSYTSVTGRVDLSYVRAYRTLSVTKLAACTRNTAGAGITAVRRGIYTVADNGDLTLVARTATNNTSYLAVTTEYVDNLDTTGGFPASYTMVKGQQYAFGHFLTFTTTAPQLRGYALSSPQSLILRPPRICARLDSQADLPTTISNGSLVTALNAVYQYALA